jgi:hypothetical protein
VKASRLRREVSALDAFNAAVASAHARAAEHGLHKVGDLATMIRTDLRALGFTIVRARGAK